MHRLVLLAGVVFVLSGCGQSPQPVIPPASAGDEPQRELTGFTNGGTTLNGSVVTDPSYDTSPYVFALTGRAGDIALFSSRGRLSDSSSAQLAAAYKGLTTDYGSSLTPANFKWTYEARYLTKTELVQLELHNSATVGGTLNGPAATWEVQYKTTPKIDSGEPNADNNPSTVTDRTLANDAALDTVLTRTMYRYSTTDLDREEWYRYTLTGGQSYKIDLGSYNPRYGTWSYRVQVYNSSGTQVGTTLNVTSNLSGGSLTVTPPTTGQYYVQIAGTWVTKTTQSNVYYTIYTLKVGAVANTAPTAVLGANPETVPNGGTTQLSPAPGTTDPDGTIALYEYDFNYDGITFTTDASNTTGAAVTTSPLSGPASITMALRVTDNGGKTGIGTKVITVQAPANQPPVAVLQANPTTVASGGTTLLSPGPGTIDPDGTITLYEYDFNYDGVTFTADANNTTGAPVTSPVLTNSGASPITITMAIRVTDNGGLKAIDPQDVIVNPAPAAPTWTQIYALLIDGDPNTTGDTACDVCHSGGEGSWTTGTKAETYTNTVNNTADCGLTLVVPGNANGSFLYQKLLASPSCGSQMPPGSKKWSATAIQMMADWINAGAQNN